MSIYWDANEPLKRVIYVAEFFSVCVFSYGDVVYTYFILREKIHPWTGGLASFDPLTSLKQPSTIVLSDLRGPFLGPLL